MIHLVSHGISNDSFIITYDFLKSFIQCHSNFLNDSLDSFSFTNDFLKMIHCFKGDSRVILSNDLFSFMNENLLNYSFIFTHHYLNFVIFSNVIFLSFSPHF